MTRKKSNKGFILFGYSIYHPINIILLFNCVVYIIQSIAESDQMLTYRLLNGFALNPSLAVDGYYWQILTYGFLHSTGGFLPLHLLMNMYGFYLLGSYIEPIIGKLKLTFLYFSAQIGGGIFILLMFFLTNTVFVNLSHDPIWSVGGLILGRNWCRIWTLGCIWAFISGNGINFIDFAYQS